MLLPSLWRRTLLTRTTLSTRQPLVWQQRWMSKPVLEESYRTFSVRFKGASNRQGESSEAKVKLERGRMASQNAGVRRRLVAGIAAATALLTLQACASRASFMSVPLAAGQTNPELQRLVARARAGDKQAQLELGIRFEEGLGVGRDIEKARDMYRLAASDSGGSVWVYVPPIGDGSMGRVMQADRGPKTPGLAEAKARLHLLERIQGKN